MVGTVKELQAMNLPYANLGETGLHIVGTGETPEERQEAINDISRIDAYFEQFTNLPENVCPNCGKHILGELGTFRWLPGHGEGRCSNCGYLVRGCHHIDEDIIIPDLFLPYHPDKLAEMGFEFPEPGSMVEESDEGDEENQSFVDIESFLKSLFGQSSGGEPDFRDGLEDADFLPEGFFDTCPNCK